MPVTPVIAAIAALLVVPTALAVFGSTYLYAVPYFGLVTASRMVAAVDF